MEENATAHKSDIFTVFCQSQDTMLTFLLWTDPFQPASDWWMGTGCFTTVTDGIGG